MNQLVLFYMGSHPDNRGRLLSEILDQDDLWFEVAHDYIQWLFPNEECSRVTPGAPTITDEVRDAFEHDEILQQHLRASFLRILRFYGLAYTGRGVQKAPNWDTRKQNWFTQDTHNNSRITRVLKCLSVLGMRREARQFYVALTRLASSEEDCGIGPLALRHWAEAVGDAFHER